MRVRSGTKPRVFGLHAATSEQDRSCWYLTLGGCPVAVSPNDQGRFHYHCEGCGARRNQIQERALALSEADEHASKCRVIPDPRSKTPMT